MAAANPELGKLFPRYDGTYRRLAARFHRTVPRLFSFLETEFGYKRVAFQIRDPQYIQDIEAAWIYRGPNMALEVIWPFSGYGFDVRIIELKEGVRPERLSAYGDAGFGRCVFLSDVVAARSGEKPLLPKSPRKLMDNDRRIRDEMPELLSETASRLRRHAGDLLRGDTARLPELQRSARAAIERGEIS